MAGPVLDVNAGRVAVWTNLYKVSPGAGWNPGADLQRVQPGVFSPLKSRHRVTA